jgi:hypothetical protein
MLAITASSHIYLTRYLNWPCPPASTCDATFGGEHHNHNHNHNYNIDNTGSGDRTGSTKTGNFAVEPK